MPTKQTNPAPEPETITLAAAPAPEPAPAEVPEWVNETPQIDYQLVMMGDDGDAAQCIDLTLTEYETLKAHLAAMRGYTQKAA